MGLLIFAIACTSPPSKEAPDDTSAPSPGVSGTIALPDGVSIDQDLTVALVRIEFGDGPLAFETLASSDLDGDTWALSWEDDAAEDVASEPGNDFPDSLVAFYLPLVFDDDDDSGSWEEGEVISGAAMDRWLVWVGGAVEGPLVAGWSVVDLGLAGQYAPNRCLSDSTLILSVREEDGYPVFYDLDAAVDVRLRGLPSSITLAGDVSGVPEGSGLVGVPYVQLDAEFPDAAYEIRPSEGTFSMTLSSEPPISHVHGSDPSWRYSVHANVVYEEQNGERGYESGWDPLTSATTCHDGQWVYSRYTWPVSDYRGLRFLDCYQGQVGWRMAFTDPDSGSVVYMDPADSAQLTVDPETCTL